MSAETRRPAVVVGVCCPACRGRGWVYVSDDRTPPVAVACRRCGGTGLVAPPAGSRAARIVALIARRGRGGGGPRREP